jgi:menaquinone-specific isochorismate synthase
VTTTTTDDAVRNVRARGLVARTVRIAGAGLDRRAVDLDLLAAAGADGFVWHHESHGLAGRGQALSIDLPTGIADTGRVAAVRAILAAVDVHDEVGLPGCGPVALGALPFDRTAAGRLVVPELLLGRRGEDAWITTVTAPSEPGPTPDGAFDSSAGHGPSPTAGLDRWCDDRLDGRREEMLADARSGRRPAGEAPDDFHLVSVIPQSAFRDLVAGAVARIRAGDLDKVVLARQISVEANRPIVTSDVLARLLALYPACMVYRVEGFIGASPELLIERHGAHVRSHPLAGTIARSGDLVADEALVAGLLASAKERSEHRFVIDGLRAALEPVCASLEIPDQPAILELRNVSHLATTIDGQLHSDGDDGGPPTALELVARVHPTPAVGGTPTAAASAYITAHEGFDRGRYAGPVGWVDAHGDGTWAIGIRAADVDGLRARMYAGVGIVADSDPGAELVETQLKLQALLAALVRP